MSDGYFQIAGFLSPLTESTVNSSLQDADPTVFKMLQFFENVIVENLQARYSSECTALGLPADPIVSYSVGYDPSPYLQESQVTFPLLAVYRKTETYERKVLGHHKILAQIGVMWILPPLTASQLERLNPFRNAVSKVLLDRILKGTDQNVNVWQAAQIEAISVKDSAFGSFPVSDDQLFPAVMMSLEVTEREMDVAQNYPPLEGVESEFDET